MVTCPLCNSEFDPGRENCHTSCSFNKGCTMIKCPYCDYEFLTESKTVNLLKSLLFRKKDKTQHEVPSY